MRGSTTPAYLWGRDSHYTYQAFSSEMSGDASRKTIRLEVFVLSIGW